MAQEDEEKGMKTMEQYSALLTLPYKPEVHEAAAPFLAFATSPVNGIECWLRAPLPAMDH